jgi:hypothetical protein
LLTAAAAAAAKAGRDACRYAFDPPRAAYFFKLLRFRIVNIKVPPISPKGTMK